jgi:hypothetical protein
MAGKAVTITSPSFETERSGACPNDSGYHNQLSSKLCSVSSSSFTSSRAAIITALRKRWTQGSSRRHAPRCARFQLRGRGSLQPTTPDAPIELPLLPRSHVVLVPLHFLSEFFSRFGIEQQKVLACGRVKCEPYNWIIQSDQTARCLTESLRHLRQEKQRLPVAGRHESYEPLRRSSPPLNSLRPEHQDCPS